MQAWPSWGMYLHFALLALASLGVALGYRYRLSIAAFFLLFTYVELIDRTTYLNHYYLVSLLSLVMIWLPLDRAWSLRSGRQPAGESPEGIPRAALWLLMAQVGLVYFFAGLAKLNPDWLVHAQPMRIWLYNSGDIPLLGPLLRETWVAYAMSWGGAIFDLTIAGWLLWSKSRPLAYGVLVVFHCATFLLFPSIGMFPWIMIAATLIFFPPDWPHQLPNKICMALGIPRRATDGASRRHQNLHPLSWQTRFAVMLALAFLTFQVIIPLRHFAYPGNVRWNGEGSLFSWRVMLTEKEGQVQYRVRRSRDTTESLIYPEAYLTPRQAERMSYQPDLILSTAHIVRDDFVSKGYPDVQVYADVNVSWNGRPAARLVDPSVDLARVRAGPGPRDWVLDAPRPTREGAGP